MTWYFQSISVYKREKLYFLSLLEIYHFLKSYDMIWERVVYKWEAKDFIGGKHSLDVSVSKSKKVPSVGLCYVTPKFPCIFIIYVIHAFVWKSFSRYIYSLPHNHNIPLWMRIWVVAFKRFCFFVKDEGKKV